MVVRYKALAAARRVPVPRVTWLKIVMDASQVYGFDGDEDPIRKAILYGKLASLFRYSKDLRQNVVDRMFVGEGLLLSSEGKASASVLRTEPSETYAVL